MAEIQSSVKAEFDMMFAKAMEQPGVETILDTLDMTRRATQVLDQMHPVSNIRFTTTNSATPSEFAPL